MGEDPRSVLVVDDDAAVGLVLASLIEQDGLSARHVTNAAAALELLAAAHFDVVVTDLRMPGMDGMELLSEIKVRWPDTPVIVLTAHGTVALAVDAMRRGAADFVLKPFEREEVLYAVRKAATAGRHAAYEPSAAPNRAGLLLGSAPPIREAVALLERAATGNATVLLRGETGTGKGLAARLVHERSPRAAGPLVSVQCAALPEPLLESELFGYEKGAFTGATSRKPGRVELAHGGTLFLDEIGDVPLSMQAKLLRLVQEREFERLGSSKTMAADLRFVAATHRNLEEMVALGSFREDLYYRLNVVAVWLPPLRERRGDVPELAQQFCRDLCALHGRAPMAFAPDALELLASQSWPGNVRQLQNFVERLVVLCDGALHGAALVERELRRQLGTLGADVPSSPPSVAADTLDGTRRSAERDALLTALERAKQNRTVAARILGVSRRTLYNKLAEHGLS